MITIRPAGERGHADHGWLNTYHTFSFASYHDPSHMGFRALRVINEDWVRAGAGFGTHPHRDMEIITYVLEGALEHRDSMGNTSVIRPGEVQRMSAGSGVTHSEYNQSPSEDVHLMQIWLLPGEKGIKPSYEQQLFPAEEKRGRLRLVASPEGRDNSVTIHQDAELYVTLLEPGETVSHALRPERHAWVQVARGAVTLNGMSLQAGDGAAVSAEERLEITGAESAEVLVFDLA
ncbi:MAG: redox-sensitive bicupin YhaK, pirin superfamily [Armatimonadetes bacterium]|jgi:redox-sensitive bicupin YhaK (pirin superfamily)|nr:redox-sensitive bicupin YhaK, pirin superfamily [Armatimonadota bacterium]